MKFKKINDSEDKKIFFLVLESKDEIRVFYTLFNHEKVCDFIRENSTISPDKVRKEICDKQGFESAHITLTNYIRGI